MEIVVLRHGRPRIDQYQRLTSAGFGQWVSAYNDAGLDAGNVPPQNAIKEAKNCAFVVCSNLRRSSESADALGVERIDVAEPVFREMDMPYVSGRCMRLSPGAWAVIFRLIWAVGYSANAESFREARERAHRCAERLAALASEHDRVLFVGHGSLNWFVCRYLRRMGWAGPRRAQRTYWEFSVYRAK